jgi:hypothetical protein
MLFCFKKLSSRTKSGFTPVFLFSLIFIAMILLISPNAFSAQVTLELESNGQLFPEGYKLYYGTTSGNYDYIIDIGNTNEYTVINLETDNTYYFASTAYDVFGLESTLSNEIVIELPMDLSDDTPIQESDNSDDPTETTNYGNSCGWGMVIDCAGNCVNANTAYDYIGDSYCDDGTWGFDLRCPEFDNDGMDCSG